MATPKKKLKKSKKDGKVWCAYCCKNILISYPHTCFDYAEYLAKGIYTNIISLKTGTMFIKRIAERADNYCD